MENNYDFYEVHSEPVVTQPPVEETHYSRTINEPPKKKRGNGTGKKFGLTITLALVFGLVAGLVFQGVNLVGSRYLGTNSSSNPTVESVQMLPGTADTSDDTASAADAVSDDATTATPVSATTLSVADIAKNVMPSVVAITAISVQEVQDWWSGQTQEYEGVGSGSGIIIGQNDEELLIATNNHVVQDAKNLSVSFYGDEVDATVLDSEAAQYSASMDEVAQAYAKNSVAAQIKGTDADNDLAVIAVQKSDIPEETMNEIKVATMGDSSNLLVGEQVVAIGNALGYGQSVTSGYVSALDRTIEASETGGAAVTGLIQTDAAINPGNSGGALLNMKGEVIGINSAKFADETVEGMGFAIPISTAQPILDELMNRETKTQVDADKAGYMGISCRNVSAEVSEAYGIPSGVYVDEVTPDGPAFQAGVKSGDVITKIDDTNVTSYDELTTQLGYYEAGETIEIVVQRAEGGEYKEQTISITLGSRPASE